MNNLYAITYMLQNEKLDRVNKKLNSNVQNVLKRNFYETLDYESRLLQFNLPLFHELNIFTKHVKKQYYRYLFNLNKYQVCNQDFFGTEYVFGIGKLQ